MEVKFNLGDPEFNKKVQKLYGWIMPVVFGILALLMLLGKAWITVFIFGVSCVLCIPPLHDFWARWHIKGFVKFVICLALVFAGVYSVGLYV